MVGIHAIVVRMILPCERMVSALAERVQLAKGQQGEQVVRTDTEPPESMTEEAVTGQTTRLRWGLHTRKSGSHGGVSGIVMRTKNTFRRLTSSDTEQLVFSHRLQVQLNTAR